MSKLLRVWLALLALCAACSVPAKAPELAADHTLLVVRDIAATSSVLAERLGFTVQKMGRFPELGIENRVVYFQDGLFFELLAVYDEAKAAGTREARFLRTREGAMGLAFEVPSAGRAAEALIGRRVPVDGPAPYPPEAAANRWLWKTVTPRLALPGDHVFAIEYRQSWAELRARNPARFGDAPRTHRNTAQRVRSVWIAVHDARKALERLRRFGLHGSRPVAIPALGARGYAIESGTTDILLLAPTGAGAIADALNAQGERVVGASIEVADQGMARRTVEQGLGESPEDLAGPYGASFLVRTRSSGIGLMLEFVAAGSRTQGSHPPPRSRTP